MRLAPLIALCLGLPLACPAAAQSPRIESFIFQADDGRTIPADRGVIQVPENRSNPGSRRIPLSWVRLKSSSALPAAPIVYLAGGPGGSGIATLEGPRQPVFLALLDVADVVVFDQRGVGASDSIPPCSADAPFDTAQPLTEATYTAYYASALSICQARWREQGADLSGYTTPEAADDVIALADALETPRVNLMGISYGSHLAFSILRRHPDRVDRVALASVEGPDQTVKSPARIDAAFDRIDTAMPDVDLVALMRRVHAAHAQPRRFTVHAPNGASLAFQADAFALQMLTGYLAKNPDGLANLFGFYAALDQGAGDAVAPYLFGAFLSRPLPMEGMPEATDLASGVSAERLADYRAQAPTALIGSAANFPMPQIIGALPGIDLGDAFRAPTTWGGPALVLSGDLDVRTPLEEQAEATAGLTARHTVVVRNGGHDLFEAHPDVPSLLIDFFSGRPIARDTLDLPAPQIEAP